MTRHTGGCIQISSFHLVFLERAGNDVKIYGILGGMMGLLAGMESVHYQ